MNSESTSGESVPVRSARKAYFWWLTLLFGAHRFYVGKWLTALVYPISVLIVIFIPDLPETQLGYFSMAYLAFLIVDACFIPRWVRQRNAWFAEDFKTHPNRYLIADSDDIAPWARGQSKKGNLGLRSSAFRVYFFFWIVPLFTGLWARELHSLEVLIIPIIVVAAIGLINTLDKMLEHQPVILEIPGVGPALERVADMRAHFWDNEPKIGSSVWGLFRHWKEYRPYWTLAFVVAATVVIESVISFGDNTARIETVETIKIIGSAALIAAFVVMVNLVPITTLSFHYSLSGKRTRLRFMTIGAVVATIFGFYIQPYMAGDIEGAGKIPSYLSQQRLENRMKDEGFRKELYDKIDMFLWYNINKGRDTKEMNEDFRSLLKGIAPNDEPDAFEIQEYDEWAAVLYYHSDAQCRLTVDPSIETDEALIPKYSVLTVMVKNTDAVKIHTFNNLPEELRFEDFEVLEDFKKLEIVDYISQRMIFYQWADFLDGFVFKKECQSSLLCEGGFGACHWLEASTP